MSFHEYYHALPKSILQDIYNRLYALGDGSGSGSGSGSGGSNQELNKTIENIHLRLINKPYFDQYFAPDFSIKKEERMNLEDFTYVLYSFNTFVLPSFLTEKMINAIYVYKYWTEGNENIQKFNKSIQYLKNLIYSNLSSDSNYNVWKHYILFWMFKYVDLTSVYTYTETNQIKNKIHSDLTNIITTSQNLLDNNFELKTNFTSLMDNLRNNNHGGIQWYMNNISNNIYNLYSSSDETQKNQFIIYLNLCVASEKEIVITTTGDNNKLQLISDSVVEIYLGDIFTKVTNRGISTFAPEQRIQIFDLI
jgi:hypothetical protein